MALVLALKAQVLEDRGIWEHFEILRTKMAFPEVFKRYFPLRTPCCFVRINARLGTMLLKCPRHSTDIAQFKRFTDLTKFKYAFNVIQNGKRLLYNNILFDGAYVSLEV